MPKVMESENTNWRTWEELPEWMKVSQIKEYYDILNKKKLDRILKRIFDIAAASIMLVILSPFMLIIALLIKADSKGGVFYRQERVTAYGKIFSIHKFRTMVSNADKIGGEVTVGNDPRITKVGAFLRKYRLDEIPQLIDVLEGNMSFVGTRPEAVHYVEYYSEEMKATLLMRAGITSEASIRYKDEARLLKDAEDADRAYIEDVLPQKMKYNLDSIKRFGFWGDIAVMFRTAAAVVKRDKC